MNLLFKIKSVHNFILYISSCDIIDIKCEVKIQATDFHFTFHQYSQFTFYRLKICRKIASLLQILCQWRKHFDSTSPS